MLDLSLDAELSRDEGNGEGLAKRQVRQRAERVEANATQDEQILEMQAKLTTLNAQLVSMIGPQPPSDVPPLYLMTTSASSSNTIASKAKAVPAPKAPEGDLAAKMAKRRRRE